MGLILKKMHIHSKWTQSNQIGSSRKLGKLLTIFGFLRSMEKLPGMAPNGAGKVIFPANPDLADILGRTDFDFGYFHFVDCLDPEFLDLQVPRFQKSGPAGFEPFGPNDVDVLMQILMFELATCCFV